MKQKVFGKPIIYNSDLKLYEVTRSVNAGGEIHKKAINISDLS